MAPSNLTAVTGVGSSPALATCETSHVLLAGVSCGFSRGSPVFVPHTDRPISYGMLKKIWHVKIVLTSVKHFSNF